MSSPPRLPGRNVITTTNSNQPAPPVKLAAPPPPRANTLAVIPAAGNLLAARRRSRSGGGGLLRLDTLAGQFNTLALIGVVTAMLAALLTFFIPNNALENFKSGVRVSAP